MCPGNPSYYSRTARRIEFLLLALFLTVQLEFALASLPAPVNISVNSTNFYHSILWDPGPGTPPGTRYKIFKRVNERSTTLNSITTSLKLKLENRKTYVFTIQALNKFSTSPISKEVFFTPYSDTKIRPLELSLAGCGNCLKINISLPEADPHSKIDDLQKFYQPNFKVLWKKKNDKQFLDTTVRTKRFTLDHLEQGAEYCVQVHMITNLNKNIDPSSLKCILTSSPLKTSGGVLVAVTVLAVLVVLIFLCFVHYTGFCCKPKVHQPKPLTTTLSQHRCTFTMERTIVDCIAITSEKGNGKATERQMLITSCPSAFMESNSGLENVQEEDGFYMNRNAQHSLSDSGCSGSGPVWDSNDVVQEKDFEQIDKEVKCDVEEPVDHLFEPFFYTEDQNPSEQTEEEEEEEEELWNNTGNVNLLSITIDAPEVEKREMEDEESEHHHTDFFTSPSQTMEASCDSYLKRNSNIQCGNQSLDAYLLRN